MRCQRQRRILRSGGVLLVAALVASACGGDDDDSSATPEAGETDPTDSSASAADDDGEPDRSEPGTDDTEPDETPDTTVNTSDTSVPAADGDADGAATSDVCTDDKVGGEITIAPGGVGASLDTFTANLGGISTGMEGTLIYSTLMRYDAATGEYQPHVAESLDRNESGDVWTLHLRPEVTFGNGDPLDADAVVAHVDRHMSEVSSSRTKLAALPFIAGYEKVDDWTVQFDLTAPYGTFGSLLADQLGQVQNVAVVDEVGQEAFSQNPVGGGAGPYEVTEWSPPERIVFTAKDDWWGGPICIEQITIEYIPDLAVRYEAYETGEVDLMFFLRDPVALEAALQAQPEAQFAQAVSSAQFMAMPNIAAGGYDGPMSDVRVRQAMAMAIDPEVVDQRAWGGAGWPGTGLVNDTSELFQPTAGVDYDPEAARELLDEYKAETGWDGTISAIAAGSPPSNQEAAIAVASMLDAVGFAVEQDFDLQLVPFISQVTADKNFELVASWGVIYPEWDMYRNLLAWASPDLGGYYNGFASPDFDAALGALRSAATIEETQAALEQMQTVLNAEVPFQVYGAEVATTMATPDIRGLVWNRGTDPIFDQAYLAPG